MLNNPDGTKVKKKIICHQLPIEPAFSLTSYGCQGQTINKVLADLWIGGFSTYVQASQVTKRESICLAEPITLSDPNKPLPTTLKKENLCISALERNSLICYGFENGTIINVHDIENEQGIKSYDFKAHIEFAHSLNDQQK